jgi:DNA-binding HxlR family transcriptional regulator
MSDLHVVFGTRPLDLPVMRELRCQIPGDSQNMRTQRLRGLERGGLVSRRVFATIPPKGEYSQTLFGPTLIRVLEQICGSAEGSIEAVLTAQEASDSVGRDAGSRVVAGKVVRLSSRRH